MAEAHPSVSNIITKKARERVLGPLELEGQALWAKHAQEGGRIVLEGIIITEKGVIATRHKCNPIQFIQNWVQKRYIAWRDSNLPVKDGVVVRTPKLDGDGNPIIIRYPQVDEEGEDLVDENGNVILEENGHVLYVADQVPKLDEEGHPLLDEEGNPILVDKQRTYVSSKYDPQQFVSAGLCRKKRREKKEKTPEQIEAEKIKGRERHHNYYQKNTKAKNEEMSRIAQEIREELVKKRKRVEEQTTPEEVITEMKPLESDAILDVADPVVVNESEPVPMNEQPVDDVVPVPDEVEAEKPLEKKKKRRTRRQ